MQGIFVVDSDLVQFHAVNNDTPFLFAGEGHGEIGLRMMSSMMNCFSFVNDTEFAFEKLHFNLKSFSLRCTIMKHRGSFRDSERNFLGYLFFCFLNNFLQGNIFGVQN